MRSQTEEYWGLSAKSYCTFIHLSQLGTLLTPGLGILIPVVLWYAHKDNNSEINDHGKIVINWIVTLYTTSFSFVTFALLFFNIAYSSAAFIITEVTLITLLFINFVFIVIGASMANKKELWPYPLAFQY